MLEAQDQGKHQGHLVVEPEEGSGSSWLFHERQIRREEEGILTVRVSTYSQATTPSAPCSAVKTRVLAVEHRDGENQQS